MAGFGGSVKLTGESEYRKALKNIRQGLRECASEMKLASAEFTSGSKSMADLNTRTASLKKTLDAQKKAISDLKAQYSAMASEYDAQLKKTNALSDNYEDEKKKLDEIARTLGTTSDEYKAQSKVVDDLEKELTDSKSATEKMAGSLTTMRTQINNAETSVIKTETSLNDLNEELQETSTDANKAGNELDNLGDSAKKSGSKFSGLKSVAGGALKALGVALAAAAAGTVAIGKNAIESYSEYEQLVGGVETLFGTGGKNIKEYAKDVGKSVDSVKSEFSRYEKAQNIVLKNSQKAYKTAGLDANNYMETVTSFSASLISSLGGDTVKAAKLADTAIIDMSDNANKMGTDIESIQNAYQGFAKQNYTMLDNLKLGYGGTQKEMFRLMQDAAKLNKEFGDTAKFSIDSKGHLEASYADMVRAIHIVQTEMGITGTTAKEAEETIQGSLNMTKSAWANLTTEIVKDNGNTKQAINQFVDSAVTLVNNLVPRIKLVVAGIGDLVNGLLTKTLPIILKELPALLTGLVPSLLKSVESVVSSLGKALPELISTAFNIVDILVSDTLPNLLKQLPGILKAVIPQLVSVIQNLVSTLSKALPEVIKILVGDVLPVLITELLNALPALVDATMKLALAIVEAIPQIVEILAPMIPEIVDSVIEALLNSFEPLLNGAITLYMAIIDAIPIIIEKLVPEIPRIVKSIASGIIKAIPILMSACVTLFDTYVDAFKKSASSVKKLIPVVLKAARDTFINYLGYVKEIWSMIKGVFSGVVSWYKDIFGKAAGAVKDAFSGLKGFFADLWDSIKDKAKHFGVSIGNAIGSAIKGVINSIIKTIEKTMNSAVKLINGAITVINKAPGVNIGKIKEFELPRLAKGGIVDKATIAQIGESGPEAVIPLENNTGWIDKLANKINANNSDNMDYNTTVRAFKTALSEMEVVLDGDEVGSFVNKTVARAIYT